MLHRHGRALDDLLGHGGRGVEEFPVLGDLHHEAEAVGFFRVDEFTREHVPSGEPRNRRRHAHGPADADDADLGLRIADQGVFGNHADVRAQEQAHPPADGVALRRADDGFLDPVEIAVEHTLGAHGAHFELVFFEVLIPARAKRFPLASEDRHPHLLVVVHVLPAREKLHRRGEAQGVQLGGPIQGDVGDLVFLAVFHGLESELLRQVHWRLSPF